MVTFFSENYGQCALPFAAAVSAAALAAAYAWNHGYLWATTSGTSRSRGPTSPARIAAHALYNSIPAAISEINAETAAAAAAVAAAVPADAPKSPFAKKVKVLEYLSPFDSRAVSKAVEALRQESPTPMNTAAIALLEGAADQFKRLVEARRGAAFNSDSFLDEGLLERLWANAFPNASVPFVRLSTYWGELGFQGLDPKTDLRGGGMLALDHFVTFSSVHGADLNAMMLYNKEQLDSKKDSWFLTAVVSIQFSTQLALGEISLQPAHLEFVLQDAGGVSQGLQRLHAMLLLHFFDVWKVKKPHVMEFTQFVKPHVIDTFTTPSWTPSLA